jgi:hypothetical protein
MAFMKIEIIAAASLCGEDFVELSCPPLYRSITLVAKQEPKEIPLQETLG